MCVSMVPWDGQTSHPWSIPAYSHSAFPHQENWLTKDEFFFLLKPDLIAIFNRAQMSKISQLFTPQLIKHLMRLEKVQKYLPFRTFLLEGFYFTFISSEAILLEWKVRVLFPSHDWSRPVNDKLHSFSLALFLLHSSFPHPPLTALSAGLSTELWSLRIVEFFIRHTTYSWLYW